MELLPIIGDTTTDNNNNQVDQRTSPNARFTIYTLAIDPYRGYLCDAAWPGEPVCTWFGEGERYPDWQTALRAEIEMATTCEDVQLIRVHITCAEDIKASDLRQEAKRLDQIGTAYEVWQAIAPSYPERIEILWVEDAGRAGITWGGDMEWTDASSPEDALERYFSDNGKAMVP